MVPESSLRIPGKYVAVYMSDKQPYHILGISYPFEVKGIVVQILCSCLMMKLITLYIQVYEEERTNDQQRELWSANLNVASNRR